MAAIKVLHSTSSSFINLHLSIKYNTRTREIVFQRANLWPKAAHTAPSMPHTPARHGNSPFCHNGVTSPAEHAHHGLSHAAERPVVPRDILARDAAILIRACASNERRSVDARVGLNLRRLLGARNGCPGPQPQKTHISTSACRRQ